MHWRTWLSEHRLLVGILGLWGLGLIAPLVLYGAPLPSADLYNHVSFTRQYQAEPFDTYLPGQGTGIQIGSYPPLSFQIAGVIDLVVPLPLPLIIQLLELLSLAAIGLLGARYLHTIGAVQDPRLAAAGIVATPGLAQMLLVFGQYPNLLALVFAMGAMVLWHQAEGRYGKTLLGCMIALTGFTHLLTMLVLGIWLLVSALHRTVRTGEEWSSLPLLPVVVGGIVVMTGTHHIITETLQAAGSAAIFHPSRVPLRSLSAAIFAFIPYHVLTLPLLYLWGRDRFEGEWLWAAGVFLVLGLGRMTPVTNVFLGLEDWLVYDRFAVIGAILVSGVVLDRAARHRQWLGRVLLGLLVVSTIGIAGLQHSQLAGNFQPLSGPVHGFGHTPEQRATTLQVLDSMNTSTRYLTLGYGRPTGDLFAVHPQPSIQTVYYTGRTSPVIRSLGLGRLDRAGPHQVDVLVGNASRLSLQYVLTYPGAHHLMQGRGWERQQVGDGIVLWTNPEPVPPIAHDQTRRPVFILLPALTAVLTTVLMVWHHSR